MASLTPEQKVLASLDALHKAHPDLVAKMHKQMGEKLAPVMRLALVKSGMQEKVILLTADITSEQSKLEKKLFEWSPRDLVSAFANLLYPADATKRNVCAENLVQQIDNAGLKQFREEYGAFRAAAIEGNSSWINSRERAFLALSQFRKELESMQRFAQESDPASKAKIFSRSWFEKVSACLDNMRPKMMKLLIEMASNFEAAVMPNVLAEIKKAALAEAPSVPAAAPTSQTIVPEVAMVETPVKPIETTTTAEVIPSLNALLPEAQVIAEKPNLSECRKALSVDGIDTLIGYYHAALEALGKAPAESEAEKLKKKLLEDFRIISRICDDIEGGRRPEQKDLDQMQAFTVKSKDMLKIMLDGAVKIDPETTKDNFANEDEPKYVLELLHATGKIARAAKQIQAAER